MKRGGGEGRVFLRATDIQCVRQHIHIWVLYLYCHFHRHDLCGAMVKLPTVAYPKVAMQQTMA